MPKYPYTSGDFTILGPEVIADQDGETIAWKGAIYRKLPDPPVQQLQEDA